MDLMTSKLNSQLQEDVLPWLFSKVDQFLEDEDFIAQNTFEIVETGIHTQKHKHLARLEEVERSKFLAEENRKEHLRKEVARKQARRVAREKRAKDQKK